MGGQLLVIFISGAVFAGAGEGFGPFQRGLFTRAEERRFAPQRQVAQTQFALARFFGTFAVHIEAKQAAVYLRGADFHELAQARFDRGVGHGFFQRQHGVGGSGGEGVIVGTVIHAAAFFKMETLKIYHGLPRVLPLLHRPSERFWFRRPVVGRAAPSRLQIRRAAPLDCPSSKRVDCLHYSFFY